MGGLRNLDAFVKTRSETQQRSVAGGLITIIAASVAGLLFVAHIVFYISGRKETSLGLADSVHVPLLPLEEKSLTYKLMKDIGRIPLYVHVTFPHFTCDEVEVSLDGALLSTGELDKIHGHHSLNLRQPSILELRQTGMYSLDNFKAGKGCTVAGKLRPHVVAGVLTIGLKPHAWAEAASIISISTRSGKREENSPQLEPFNVSHYVHRISFGTPFPLAEDKPLEDRAHVIKNEFGGIAVEFMQIKLIPTLYRRLFSKELTFQESVVQHSIQPQTLVAKGVQYLPGLVLNYDFTPLAVHHSLGRDNFLSFLSSLVSILGGVFVTVGLVSGCLVHSAQAVAKKID